MFVSWKHKIVFSPHIVSASEFKTFLHGQVREAATFIACLYLQSEFIVNKYKKYSIEVTIQFAQNRRKEMSQEQA
jgi:hypothetical protein